MFVPDSNQAIKVYEQKNAIEKNAEIGRYFISQEKYKELRAFEIFPNDIIVSCAGTIGETFVMPHNMRKGIINQALMKISLYNLQIIDFYLIYFDFRLKSLANEQGYGVALKNIPPFDILKKYLVPIPPINEQYRIIKENENILNLIQQIGNNRNELNKIKTLLKSKILELAIQGQLVPQDKNDEPANVLLERIRAERKAKLGKKYVESYIFKGDDNCYYEKVGNTSKKISDEMSFDLPFGWCWITLKEIATITSGKTPKNEQITDLGNIPYFKVGDMNLPGNEIFMEVVQYYVNDCYTGITFPKNSFIFPKNGGALLTNKKRILKQESLVDLNTGVLIPSSAVNNEFMFYLFSTVDFTKNYKGSTIPTIDNEMIGNIVFALPPIEEQSRIVQKIKAIMSILKGGD